MLLIVQVNGVLGADVHAGVGDAALAAVRDADLLGRAGVAGEGDDIDQGFFKVLVVGIHHFLDVGADRGLGTGGLQVHAQGQTHPLFHDGTLQEHVVTVVGHLTPDHLVGDHVHTAHVPALVGQAGNLGKYVAANIVYRAVNSSHVHFLHFCRAVAFRPG